MECGESGLGTWFPLQQACLATVFPWVLLGMRRMVCLDVILSLLFGNGLPTKDQMTKLGPAVSVGSNWGFGSKEIGVIGHAARSEFKAQMVLGTLVSYKIYTRIQECLPCMLSTIAFDRKEVDNATSGGFQDQC